LFVPAGRNTALRLLVSSAKFVFPSVIPAKAGIHLLLRSSSSDESGHFVISGEALVIPAKRSLRHPGEGWDAAFIVWLSR
jgi:hypothetical protein